MVIDEKQEQFLEEPDIKLDDINNSTAIKSNFHLMQKNKVTLLIWLKRLKAYVKYLRSLIDLNNIILEVIEYLAKNKPRFYLAYLSNPGESTIQEVNKQQYQIKRTDLYTFEIINLTNSDWESDRLIIQCKNDEGNVVYPVIQTKGNMVRLNFADGITHNYYMYWV